MTKRRRKKRDDEEEEEGETTRRTRRETRGRWVDGWTDDNRAEPSGSALFFSFNYIPCTMHTSKEGFLLGKQQIYLIQYRCLILYV